MEKGTMNFKGNWGYIEQHKAEGEELNLSKSFLFLHALWCWELGSEGGAAVVGKLDEIYSLTSLRHIFLPNAIFSFGVDVGYLHLRI